MLYLRGLSTGDFREALVALLGDDTAGLSSTNIARLTNEWETDYRVFQKRSLADSWGDLCDSKEVARAWADRLLGITTARAQPDKNVREHFHGTSACPSALYHVTYPPGLSLWVAYRQRNPPPQRLGN